MSWATDMAGLSPTGWWKHGETSGAFADSGSGNHPSSSVGSGVTRNVTSIISGETNKAVTLDGSANAWIDYGDVDDLDGGSYSILCAFKLDGNNAGNYRRLINKFSGDATAGFELGLMKSTDTPSNGIYFDHKASGTKEVLSGPLLNNIPYLVVIVYDATADTLKAYINGQQSGSTITGVTNDLANNAGSLIFGNNQGKLAAAAFSGTLDDVAVWKGTALSDSQIATLGAYFPQSRTPGDTWAWSDTASGAPGTPTLTASGTLFSVAAGADAFNRIIAIATDGPGSPSSSVYRVDLSSDGGSNWADVTSHCTTHKSGSSWLIAVNRPDKGSQAIAQGGTAQLRVKLAALGMQSGYSNTVTITGVGVQESTVDQKYAQKLKTYLDTSANANAEADGAYPGVILSALAYAQAAGYTPTSGSYLTACSDFWALIKSRGNINADYIHTPAAYAGTTQTRRDFHFRLIVHLIVAARILRDNVGGGTATALASDMLDYANRMGKAAFDHLARSTNLDTNTGDTYHTAWSSGAFAAGEIRKPTAPNGHYYRAMNAGANTTEPTWPTPSGSTVTHQGVTWEECSYTADTFAQTYNPAGYLPTGTYTWDGNQNSEIAAALMLLRDEPGTDFAPGGSYATSGYNHAVGELSLCAVMQYKNGEVPVTATGPHDTHYGSFQFHTTAIALHILGPGAIPAADLWLARAANWFNTSYATEPTISNAGAGGYATYHRLAEPVWRAAGFDVAQLTNTLGQKIYRTSSYVQGTDVIYTEWGYTPENDVWPYAYFFEALADHMAVIGRIEVTAGDTWSWTDAAARTISARVSATDTWAWSDSASQVLGHSSSTGTRTATDSWAWTDTAAGPRVTPATYPRTAADIWLWQDQVTRPVTPSPPEDPGYRLTFDIGPYL